MSLSGIGYSGFNRYDMYGYAPAANAAGNVTGNAAVNTNKSIETTSAKALKQMSAIECQTCKNRTYQDGSNDPGVSFKTPGHIDPVSAGVVVRAHEQEHVSNEQAKARAEGRRVVSQSVSITTATCPECGRVYVSGGVTRTVTASEKNSQGNTESPYKQGKSVTGQRFDKEI